MRRLFLFLSVAVIGAAIYAPAAVADDRICNGTIGAISTDDNIVVPAGGSCRLEGTQTDGNVLVHGNASLTALGVRVGGNIQGERHRAVTVLARGNTRSVVDGNIQLERGGPGRVDSAVLDGNLQVEEANGRQAAIGNVIGGDLQAFGNRGGFEIRSNRISGNLQCSGNAPPPHGGDNSVSGDREGQCARLNSTPPNGAPQPPPPPAPAAAPRLRLRVLGGRQVRRITRIRVRCSTDCTVRANGRIVLRRDRGRSTLRLRSKRTRLAAGQSRVMRLALTPRRVRKVRRAIRSGRATARMVIRARATNAGKTTTKRRVVGPLRVR